MACGNSLDVPFYINKKLTLREIPNVTPVETVLMLRSLSSYFSEHVGTCVCVEDHNSTNIYIKVMENQSIYKISS